MVVWKMIGPLKRPIVLFKKFEGVATTRIELELNNDLFPHDNVLYFQQNTHFADNFRCASYTMYILEFLLLF